MASVPVQAYASNCNNCKLRHGSYAAACGASVASTERLTMAAAQIAATNTHPSVSHYWEHSNAPPARLYRLLKLTPIPNTKREISAHPPSQETKGLAFGITWSPKRQPYCSTGIYQLKEIVNQINIHLDDTADPFCYTSIQLNAHLSAKLHTDRNNHGPSKTIALAPFSGGWLWEHRDPCGCLYEPSIWQDVNGTNPHQTLPHHGPRFSIVLYTHHAATHPDAGPALSRGRALGF